MPCQVPFPRVRATAIRHQALPFESVGVDSFTMQRQGTATVKSLWAVRRRAGIISRCHVRMLSVSLQIMLACERLRAVLHWTNPPASALDVGIEIRTGRLRRVVVPRADPSKSAPSTSRNRRLEFHTAVCASEGDWVGSTAVPLQDWIEILVSFDSTHFALPDPLIRQLETLASTWCQRCPHHVLMRRRDM